MGGRALVRHRAGRVTAGRRGVWPHVRRDERNRRWSDQQRRPACCTCARFASWVRWHRLEATTDRPRHRAMATRSLRARPVMVDAGAAVASRAGIDSWGCAGAAIAGRCSVSHVADDDEVMHRCATRPAVEQSQSAPCLRRGDRRRSRGRARGGPRQSPSRSTARGRCAAGAAVRHGLREDVGVRGRYGVTRGLQRSWYGTRLRKPARRSNQILGLALGRRLSDCGRSPRSVPGVRAHARIKCAAKRPLSFFPAIGVKTRWCTGRGPRTKGFGGHSTTTTPSGCCAKFGPGGACRGAAEAVPAPSGVPRRRRAPCGVTRTHRAVTHARSERAGDGAGTAVNRPQSGRRQPPSAPWWCCATTSHRHGAKRPVLRCRGSSAAGTASRAVYRLAGWHHCPSTRS